MQYQTAYLTRGEPPSDFIQVEQNGLTLTKRVGHIGQRSRIQSKEASDTTDVDRTLRRWFQTAAKNGYVWTSASIPPSPQQQPIVFPPDFAWRPPPPSNPQHQPMPPPLLLYQRQRSHSSHHRRVHHQPQSSHGSRSTSPPPPPPLKRRQERSRSQKATTTSMRQYQRHRVQVEQEQRQRAAAQPAAEIALDELAFSGSSRRRHLRTAGLSSTELPIDTTTTTTKTRRTRRRSRPQSPVRYVRRPSRLALPMSTF